MYFFLRNLVRWWFIVTARPQKIHGERFPETGPVILAANHCTAAETALVPAMMDRQPAHVAKSELFTDPRPFHKLLGKFLYWAGVRPMDRSGGRASAQSIADVVQHVRDGGAVVIFPEGTRAPDDRLYKGKTGVARLALATGAPVIPLGLVGTRARRHGWWPFARMWRPQLRYGEPLDFSEWAGGIDDRAVLRHVTDQVMAAIQQLTGQEYVDVYAASLRSAQASGRALDAVVQPSPGADRPTPPLPGRPPAEESGDKLQS